MAGVKLVSLKYHVVKLTVFGSVLLYLAIDLLVWHGPIWNFMYGGKAPAVDPADVVAEVYGEPITIDQLNRHEAEQDTLAGRSTPETARRASMLMDLVRGKLLLIRTRYNDTRLPDFHAEAAAEVAKLGSRTATSTEFERSLQSQGYGSIAQYADKMEVRMESAALLENAIAPHCSVSDEEVARVYEQLKNELPAPARRRVSHIFLETLHKDPAQVEKRALDLLASLQAGADFAALAREQSQDAHSAPHGGDLGILEDTSTRPLPELPLFGENAIPAGTPVAIQSKWGWHILLAGDITPAGKRTFEECRESIRTAIISSRREQAVNAWFKGAVREGFIKKRIRTHVK